MYSKFFKGLAMCTGFLGFICFVYYAPHSLIAGISIAASTVFLCLICIAIYCILVYLESLGAKPMKYQNKYNNTDEIDENHWKCPQCRSINEITDKECPLCHWKP